MSKKYLMVSLEDPRTRKIAAVLSNKTCKKIIDMLAEKEASKSEIAKALKIPLNTTEYNVNKLVEAGLIEKSKNYFWSAKGKKIEIYKISNKA
ncbi:MAG: helix-turn-helix domain-containing protein, partial [Candidatus Pacearchaeota archaeon]|nr:helix-turn-helix domain-containing protein [Candidatus Pacearchaeota archaeon]